MQNITKVAVIALIFLSISPIGCVSGQTRQPGVMVGDTFKYTFNFDINATSSQFDFPSILEGLVAQVKDIDWVQTKITQVSGTTVTAQTTMQFKNGTQMTNTQTSDVATGEGELSMFLIAANLNPNDRLYTGNDQIINGTQTITYPSGTRQVNYEIINSSFTVTQEELKDFNITGPLEQNNLQQTYWDKQTGALVEMSYSMVSRSELLNADISLNVKLIETSVYTVPEYSGLTYLVIVLMASLLAIGSVKLTKKWK